MRADSKNSQAVRRLAIAIVNWRTAPLAIDALESIATEFERYPCFDVFVVDNASGDGSDEQIERAIRENQWGSFARLIRAEKNGGFAAGNNIVFRQALANPDYDYILLLNPDTLVRSDAFRILVDFMDANPEAGIAGGLSEDPDATPQNCSFKFPSAVTEFSNALGFGLFDRIFRRMLSVTHAHSESVEVDWVSGAHMIVRRTVFEEIGLMDESYFLYFEETDFTFRAKKAGWKCWHVPASRIVHLVGQSSGITEKDLAQSRRPAYWYESRRRYFVLNHGRLYACVVDLLVMFGFGIRRLRGLVQHRADDFPAHFVSDLFRYGALINGRRSLPSQQVQ